MAVGVPFVVTPLGTTAEIGVAGETHLEATTQDEWRDALGRLLSDAALRRAMGAAGRAHSVAHFGVPAQADKLARALREAAGGRTGAPGKK
jgi:glycosyltransferase involved in cell wall biosynthesis